jgi:hypothetical protein
VLKVGAVFIIARLKRVARSGLRPPQGSAKIDSLKIIITIIILLAVRESLSSAGCGQCLDGGPPGTPNRHFDTVLFF